MVAVSCRRRCSVEGGNGVREDRLLGHIVKSRRQGGVECANCEKVIIVYVTDREACRLTERQITQADRQAG